MPIQENVEGRQRKARVPLSLQSHLRLREVQVTDYCLLKTPGDEATVPCCGAGLIPTGRQCEIRHFEPAGRKSRGQRKPSRERPSPFSFPPQKSTPTKPSSDWRAQKGVALVKSIKVNGQRHFELITNVTNSLPLRSGAGADELHEFRFRSLEKHSSNSYIRAIRDRVSMFLTTTETARNRAMTRAGHVE